MLIAAASEAQTLTTRDYAIEVTACVQESPPAITLNWYNNGDGQQYLLQRKSKAANSWDSSFLLAATASSFVDTNVNIGEAYEYGLTKYPSSSSPQSGYIYAGIRLPAIETRGTVILLVDNSFTASLSSELAQLQQDLVADGWTVLRHDVARTNSPASIKSIIRSDYLTDPSHVRTVFILGHIAVPRSGDYTADDHTDHTGAWVADTFYGDIDDDWSDSTVRDTKAIRAANRNIPGDGKFDQSAIPSDIELEVGRVDFANLPAFLPRTELDLLRAYLDKDHDFRVGALRAQRRALLYDGFGESGGEAYAASGWRNFAPLLGANATTAIGDNQFFPTVSAQDFLWSYVASGGDGNYSDCYSVGNTASFANYNIQTIFTMVFGSYWGDWDATNDFFRATLGSGDALAVAWAGRPHWYFHHMALGETIGYSTRLVQNNQSLYVPNLFRREVHISLLGDPTLRMHVISPPTTPIASTNNGTVSLNWQASEDNNVIGYYVYRANTVTEPFVRLTPFPVSTTSFTDSPGNGSHTYMVKAVKLETTPSGTYTNLSEGTIATVLTEAPQTPVNLGSPSQAQGNIQFQLFGAIGQRFILEASFDLQNWASVTTNTISGSSMTFTATNSQVTSKQFFRTKLIP